MKELTTKGIIFAGGVLGTVKLLLRMKKKFLPRLSERVGMDIRTNNESLIAVTSYNRKLDLSKGLAIGSLFQADENTHLEICRYGRGSGAWKWSMLPLPEGRTLFKRFLYMGKDMIRNPRDYIRYILLRDWAKSSVVLLFMQDSESKLCFKLNRLGKMISSLDNSPPPNAFIPQAHEYARKLGEILDGKAWVFGLVPILGASTTAHVLGGAVIGENRDSGVIDKYHRVFGYYNMYVCDGSAVSANPGVNPSLTITAMTERAMSFVPENPVIRNKESSTKRVGVEKGN